MCPFFSNIFRCCFQSRGLPLWSERIVYPEAAIREPIFIVPLDIMKGFDKIASEQVRLLEVA